MKKQAIIRLVVLLIVGLNLSLVAFGKNPLPWSEEQIYVGVSSASAVVVSVWTWWKNNNITQESQDAQGVLDYFKKEGK